MGWKRDSILGPAFLYMNLKRSFFFPIFSAYLGPFLSCPSERHLTVGCEPLGSEAGNRGCLLLLWPHPSREGVYSALGFPGNHSLPDSLSNASKASYDLPQPSSIRTAGFTIGQDSLSWIMTLSPQLWACLTTTGSWDVALWFCETGRPAHWAAQWSHHTR